MFKERELLKKKTIVDWTEEIEIKKDICENNSTTTYNYIRREKHVSPTSYNTTWVGLPNVRYRLKYLLHQKHIRKGLH